MIQWSAAVVIGATVAAGPAGAVTIFPGGTFALTPNTVYNVSETYFGPGSGTDIFKFTYSSAVGSPVLDTTTNVNVGGTGFSVLTLDWLSPTLTSLISGPLNVPITNLINEVMPLSAGFGTYELVINWVVKGDSIGSYTSFLKTPVLDRQNPVPLPPALILFGSALFGMTVLRRRKRKGATA